MTSKRMPALCEYAGLEQSEATARGALCIVARPNDSPYGASGTWRLARVTDSYTDRAGVGIITHTRDRLGTYAMAIWRGRLDSRGRYAMTLTMPGHTIRARALWRAHGRTVWHSWEACKTAIRSYIEP